MKRQIKTGGFGIGDYMGELEGVAAETAISDECGFGRGACLDISSEMIDLETVCDGMPLYCKADGAHVLARSDGRTAFGQERMAS